MEKVCHYAVIAVTLLLASPLFAALAEEPGLRSEKAAVAERAGVPDGYRIGPGDSLQVIVYKEPEASVPEVVVRSDGKISLPFVKEVEIAGLAMPEAEKLLTARFAPYINSPDITLIVRQINSRKVYLAGGVRSPGVMDLRGEMTVLQAIVQAGGLTDYAKRKRIYILRDQGAKKTRLSFNFDAVIKGEHMEENVVLQPNDMVVVPQ